MNSCRIYFKYILQLLKTLTEKNKNPLTTENKIDCRFLVFVLVWANWTFCAILELV